MKPRPALAVLALVLAFAARPPHAAAQSPVDAEQRFSTGIMHLREGRVDLALEELKRAARQDPKNPYFQKGLGLAYARKATDLQLAAARRNPDAGPVGEWKDAIACFRKALELNPYYVDVRNDLGAALIGSGDREGGKKEFLAAFSDPTNPAPEMSARNLGQAYLEEKNFAEAVNWFRTSVGRNKSYPDPYLGLAEALLRAGRPDEALVELETGHKEVPDDLGLRLALGQAYFRAGRFTEARAQLDEVLKRDPSGAPGRAAAEQLKALPK
jgi:Tfp pilus assembly protein PilF